MDYISVSEAAKKWGISGRSITDHLVAGRIPGAVKKGKMWLIPASAGRPADKRRRKQALPEPKPKPEQTLSLAADLSGVFASTTVPLPDDNPDAILDTLDEDRLRLIFEAELAYLRGDFARTMACCHKVENDDAARLRICPLAIVAAVSMRDYQAYTEIETYLKRIIKIKQNSTVKAVAELSLATAAVSMIAPNMAPQWLKTGDFSAIPPLIRPNALYLRAKYFYSIKQLDTVLAVAQTVLTLSSPEQGITTTDLYLRLTCAVACHALGQEEEAKCWLLSSMRLALPHGFITPFAELLTSFSGLMEQCLEQEFPACYDTVLEQWQRTWKNWIIFHNQFTKDNITLILTLREYHLAALVVHRVPYAKIAKQYGISVGRLRNIMQEVREKLLISDRNGLEKYIL